MAVPHFAVHVATHVVPHDVFVATTHQFATHLHKSQVQAQRLMEENAHLQGRIAELLKRVEELQESFDLQERVVQTQSELIQTLESEEARPSPFLRPPIEFLSTVLSSQPESIGTAESTPIYTPIPSMWDPSHPCEQATALTDAVEEPSLAGSSKRHAEDSASGDIKRRVVEEDWPFSE